MKVLVTGGKGQLGVDVTTILQNKLYEVYSFGKDELEITDAQKVFSVFDEIKPDIVVHAAAYTQVDKAEEDEDRAFAVNAIGTRNLAVACEKHNAKMIYISTDYVFDGNTQRPYHEFSLTNPLSVYGKSKLAGEHYVQNLSSKYFILRTSWVYGKYGNNFVKTMLAIAKDRSEINVVNDQYGSPTYSVDLANFISIIMNSELYGIYHFSNSGYCSWYEFAKAIFELANLEHIKVNPVTTFDFPRPAPRPAFSVMDHMTMRNSGFGYTRHWKEALEDFINDY